MSTPRVIVTTVFAALLATASAPAGGPYTTEAVNAGSGTVVVLGLGADATAASVAAQLAAKHPGAQVVDEVASRGVAAIHVPLPGPFAGRLLEDLRTRFVADGTLRWAELRAEAWVPEARTAEELLGLPEPDEDAGGAIPPPLTGSFWFWTDDPIAYREQYAASRLDLATARGFSTGAGTVVALIDGDVNTGHPELSPRLLPPLAVQPAPEPGMPGAPDGDSAGVEHGTFLAGLVHLVAPDALILPVPIVDEAGETDTFTVARALYAAIDAGVEVIHLNVTSLADATVVREALVEAEARGIPVVAPVGNVGTAQPALHPATSGLVIAVGATDELDRPAPLSSLSEHVVVSAPGASVVVEQLPNVVEYDLERSVVSSIANSGYSAWEGTSLSAALVTGVVALVRAQHPEWDASPATVAAIRATLRDTAAPLAPGAPGLDGLLGAGRVDAGAATALGGPAPSRGDLDRDGVVGPGDVRRVLDAWGATHDAADVTLDGTVGPDDLLDVLSRWSGAGGGG